MANPNLFSTWKRKTPATDAQNREGAPAYAFGPEHRLAQYATTGCLSGSFYATAREQLDTVLALCDEVSPEFVAKTAVHARERGYMKDMPALLLAVLSVRDGELLEAVFDRVVDNGKMLRNFVQIIRSGTVGRRSLGSRPRRLVRGWLAARSEEQLFRASVGSSPRLSDVVRMVHPKPGSRRREAFYGWLLGLPHDARALPEVVRGFEAFKAGETREVPDVPFPMLTALPLGKKDWRRIAERATWHQTRMNLNAFARHGVFDEKRRWLGRRGDEDLVSTIARRLRNRSAIRKARAFPYQLMVAHAQVGKAVPRAVRNSLEAALEIALSNVPALDGKVFVFPDVSGSMTWAATGARKGATSVVRCIDVAALVAAAVLRRNPTAEVVPFETRVVRVRLDPRRTVLANAERLARVGGGGTNCSAPLARLNRQGKRGDLVIYVSDNQSWVDASSGRGTPVMREWEKFKRRSPRARMVCLDVQPYGTTQASEREDILNIGGFSDRVFDVIGDFAAGRLSAGHWVSLIEKVRI